MIGQAVFAKNYNEIKEAEEMGIEPPEMIDSYGEFGFKISDIKMFHKDQKGRIVLIFNNDNWTIKYEEEIWNKLIQEFKD